MRKGVKVIEVTRYPAVGTSPSYLALCQRHLEKEKPGGNAQSDGVHFTVPVDLLGLTMPLHLVEGITEVELVYKKR